MEMSSSIQEASGFTISLVRRTQVSAVQFLAKVGGTHVSGRLRLLYLTIRITSSGTHPLPGLDLHSSSRKAVNIVKKLTMDVHYDDSFLHFIAVKTELQRDLPRLTGKR